MTKLKLQECMSAGKFEIIGRKSGQLITVHKYGVDDYSAWWRDESDRDNETAGYSVRGTAEQIIKELEGEWHD